VSTVDCNVEYFPVLESNDEKYDAYSETQDFAMCDPLCWEVQPEGIYDTIVNPKHGKGASSFGIPSIKSLMSSGEIKGIQEVFQPARLAVMPHLL
jgi:hypothetical protein